MWWQDLNNATTSSPAGGGVGGEDNRGGTRLSHGKRSLSIINWKGKGGSRVCLQIYTHEIYNTLSHNAKIYKDAIRTTLTKDKIYLGIK